MVRMCFQPIIQARESDTWSIDLVARQGKKIKVLRLRYLPRTRGRIRFRYLGEMKLVWPLKLQKERP